MSICTNLIGSSDQKSDWKKELLNSYTTLSDLVRHQLITSHESDQLHTLSKQFKIRITPYYAQLIEPDRTCPIRIQSIPQLGEEDPILPNWATEWSHRIYQRPFPWYKDAIGDIKNKVVPRLTHRYTHRAILHTSSMCAMYCRFCFRKTHLNDEDKVLYEGSLDPAFQYLENHTEISELILTGGDPLSLTDPSLRQLFGRIALIPHIKTVRIHSRMAVTLPSRFTKKLLEIFRQDWGFNLCLVSHFNHPKELTNLAREKLKEIKKTGITLLNQTVLMSGVNVSVITLETLFQSLYEIGVIPYYLHHPDWTPGTFHYRINIETGQEIIESLRGKLSGPALPDYILDIPQGYGKISLLGRNLKLIERFNSPTCTFQGAIYEVNAPSTRFEQAQKYLYLDLAKKSEHRDTFTCKS